MATLTSSLIVRLIDQVTGPAKAVTKSLLGIENAAKGGAAPSFADKMASAQTRVGAAIERNNAALDRAHGRVIEAVGGIYLLKQGFDATLRPAMSFESAMADVAKVSGFDDAGLDAYGKRLRKLAVSEIPLAVDELAALSAAAAQSGIEDADLFDFTRMTARAAVAWEMTGAAAGESLAKIKTQLGLTTAQTAAYADAINHMSDNTASSSRDLVDYTRRVAAQGAFFGYAKEETLAFGAALIAAGAPAEVAATSFRNMGRALTRGASATKAQRGAWLQLGMDAEEVAKSMQEDAVGTTLKVMEALGNLPEHMQASVMSDLFGDEARALAPLLKDTDQLRRALAMVANETDYAGSVTREFERRAMTAEYRVQRFKSQLNDIGLTIGGALIPALNDLTEILGPIIIKISDLASEYPDLTRAIVATTAGFVALRVATAALTFAGLLGKGGALSMVALGLKGITKVGTPVAGFFETLRVRNALATASLGKTPGLMSKIGDAGRVLLRMAPGFGVVTSALTAVGGALATISAPVWGGIAAAAAVFAAAGALIWKYWDRIKAVLGGVGKRIMEELQPAFEAMQPWLEKAQPLFDLIGEAGSAIGDGFAWAAEKVKEFGEWLGSFFQQEVLTDAEKAQWEDAGYDVADRFINSIKSAIGGLIDWFTSLPSKIIAAIGSIDLSSVIDWPSLPGWLGGDTPAPANDNAADGHRAKGGPVWSGNSYLVGEEEPEIFTPNTGGEVTPLSAIERKLDRMVPVIRDTVARVGRSAPASPAAAMTTANSGGSQISLSIGKIVVQEAANARETARAVRDELTREIEALLRGAHADMELR